jgi:large subunit ribosomal protein L25
MTALLKAEARIGGKKSELSRLRKEGKVPAVVYGKKVPSTPIAIDGKALAELLRGHNRSVIEMEIPGHGKHPVMVHEVHRDSILHNILHVDFHQVSMDEPIRAEVAVEFEGEAPGVREGGVLAVVQHEVEVQCLPQHLPGAIVAEISGLQLGDSILAGQLQLPEGVRLLTDESAVLATVLVPQKAADEEAETAEANNEAARDESKEAK